jgi:hypothetical protein
MNFENKELIVEEFALTDLKIVKKAESSFL